MTSRLDGHAGRGSIFSIKFRAIQGVEVNIYYTVQNHLFDSDHDPPTIVAKTLVDQLIHVNFRADTSLALVFL